MGERQHPGPRPVDPALEPVDRHVADRHEPLLVALADDAHEPAVHREVLGVQPDGLADAQAGGVEELQERPVAQSERVRRLIGIVAAGGLEQGLGLGDGQRLGQQPRLSRQVEVRRHVHRDPPLAIGEPVEPLQRGGAAAQAGGARPGSPGRPRRACDARYETAASADRSHPGAHSLRANSREVVAVRADRGVGQPAFHGPGAIGTRRWPPRACRAGLIRPSPTLPRQASARSSSSRAAARPAAAPAPLPQHLRQLDDPALAVQPLDLGDGPAVPLALADPELGVGMGRDLREVRDAQHLVAAGQRPQAAPDRVGAAPADARVHLVEHEGRRRVRLGEDLLDRQRDARQLAAGGDPGERAERLAGIRGEAIDDLVHAGGIEGDRVAIELHRRLPRPAAAAVELDGDAVAFDATGIDQVVYRLAPNPGEPVRPLARIASGGELSRVALAIKEVLADADATPDPRLRRDRHGHRRAQRGPGRPEPVGARPAATRSCASRTCRRSRPMPTPTTRSRSANATAGPSPRSTASTTRAGSSSSPRCSAATTAAPPRLAERRASSSTGPRPGGRRSAPAG